MKLICEVSEDIKVISEEKDNKKNLYITGIFMQSECRNKNGRRYPRDVMEAEVNRYLKEAIAARRAFGELGHPDGPQINLDRVSHMIESLKMQGNDVVGRAKVLETPMGDIVKGLLEGGANLGVSSRGLGSLKQNGDLMEVQNDFRLVTAADIVADPSAPNAWITAIVESQDWVFQNGTWQIAEQCKKEIKRMSKRQLEESKMRLFKFFLNSI